MFACLCSASFRTLGASASLLSIYSPVSKLLDGHGHLGLDDGVDTADLVGDLPCALEEERLVDVTLNSSHGDGCCG